MIKKSFLLFFFVGLAILAQEENQPAETTMREESPRPTDTLKPIPKEKQEESASIDDTKKKYSAQIIFGNGKGFLDIQSDKYDPTVSLPEFLALSLLSTSLASPAYTPVLSGNLGANSLLTLFWLNDLLTSSPIRSNSSSVGNRFYLENKFKNEAVGFQFGISSGNYIFKADSSRYATVFLPAAFFGNSNPLINIFMFQSYLKNAEPVHIGIHTFDFALNFHIFPGNRFDPYFNIGAGIGSCYTNCTILRAFGRAGIRWNFENHYLFLEQELQIVYFSIKNNIYSPLQERISLLGFGFYL